MEPALVAQVELRVANVSRANVEALEGLLSQWAEAYRQQHILEAENVQHQLLQGTLQLDMARLFSEGVVDWQDRLAPVGTSRPDTRHYEEVEPPCRYERATAELLAPAASDSSLLLPGAAAAAKRRQLAEASIAERSDSLPLAATAAPAAKRQRIFSFQCFNCGSYKHNVSMCPVPIDKERVNSAKAERGPAPARGAIRFNQQRYFLVDASETDKQQQHTDVQPGRISAQLAEALGMPSASAPPPWISRMVVLGVPPKYTEQNVGGQNPEPEPELLVFYRGSEDESDQDGEDDTKPEQQQQEQQQQVQPCSSATMNGTAVEDEGSESSEEGEDFIPFCDEAAPVEREPERLQHNASKQQQQQPDGHGIVQQETKPQVQQLLSPPLQQGDNAQQQQPQQQEQQRPKTPPGGAGVQQAPLYCFPGINADLPAGADADSWQQEVNKGLLLCRGLA